MKRTIDLEPNDRGLAIVVPYFYSLLGITDVLTRALGFAVYEPQDKLTLKSYMQAVDLVELKYHPIIVTVHGIGKGNLPLQTDIGDIDINEDVMAPLFPPIATHLADNPKIFLFIVNSGSSESHSFVEVDAIWENCIVGYITCSDEIRVTDIVERELRSDFMSIQEIFTSISDQLPSTATMTLVDRLKEPVYLHPRRPEIMDRFSVFSLSPTLSSSGSEGIVTCL